MSTLQDNVAEIMSLTYGGIHHINLWDRRKDWGHAIEVTVYGGLSTFDFCHLTSLVVLCHDRAVRMEVTTSAPRYLKLMFHQRQHGKYPDMDISKRHPTMEEHINIIRGATPKSKGPVE